MKNWNRMFRVFVMSLAGCCCAAAQTGTALPATCSTGEAFVLTTAAAGANFFVCTATNVWTVQGSGTATAGPATVACTDTGSANTVVCTVPNVTAYTNGMVAYVIPAAGNTGPTVINLNGLVGKAITKNGRAALTGGELRASVVTHLQY